VSHQAYPLSWPEGWKRTPAQSRTRARFNRKTTQYGQPDAQDRSSLLSADEARRLARIARDRANRFMVSAPDVDFLLDVIVRLSR